MKSGAEVFKDKKVYLRWPGKEEASKTLKDLRLHMVGHVKFFNKAAKGQLDTYATHSDTKLVISGKGSTSPGFAVRSFDHKDAHPPLILHDGEMGEASSNLFCVSEVLGVRLW